MAAVMADGIEVDKDESGRVPEAEEVSGGPACILQ